MKEKLKLVGIEKFFLNNENKRIILDNVNLTIYDGEFVCILGYSGCGKSTLLRIIANFEEIEKGKILLDGKTITKSTPKIFMMFQSFDQLFPWKTIKDNLVYALKVTKIEEDKKKANNIAIEYLGLVGLSEYINSYPHQLSGGMKQRAALARALSLKPDVLLMDEPLGSLDAITRNEIQKLILDIWEKYKITIVFVTHDMDEAIKMADRICVIQNGRIVQCDTAENILKHPANDYVKLFIGQNRLWSNPDFIKAKDIMLKNPCRISANRTVIQALQVMNHARVDSVLVTDNNKFKGIVWLEDLKNFEKYNSPLEDFISEDYHAVNEETSLKDIVNTVNYEYFGIIPVLNDNQELCGFLTKSRLLAVLSRQYQNANVQRGGALA